jgi:hypothetical protein
MLLQTFHRPPASQAPARRWNCRSAVPSLLAQRIADTVLDKVRAATDEAAS